MTPPEEDGPDDPRRLGFRRPPEVDRSRSDRFRRLLEASREAWRARTEPLTGERVARLAREREDLDREGLREARERGARFDPETGSLSLPPDLD